jgi:hypothetical protein
MKSREFCLKHFKKLTVRERYSFDASIIRDRWGMCFDCGDNVRCDTEGHVLERVSTFK